jgi:glycosyltransferase involved in cell wall biosynthesis
MRIAHIATTISLNQIVLNQMVYQKNKGHDVVALGPDDEWAEGIRDRGIRVIDVPFIRHNLLATGWAGVRTRAVCRRERFDVVHTHNALPGVMGRIAARLAGVPCVLHTWHSWPARLPRPLHIAIGFRLLEPVAVAAAHAVLFLNPDDMTTWGALAGVDRRKARLIGNGINVAEFQKRFSPDARARVRGELGLSDHAFVIVKVARMEHPRKGHEFFLEAVQRLLQGTDRDIVVLLAGQGDGEPAIRAATARLGLESKVRFLGYRKDVSDVLAASDLSVLASPFEGVPRALMESMALSVPVVGTDVPGTRMLVKSGESGLLAPFGDVGALAQAMRRLMEDPTLAKKLAENGRARVETRFNEPDVAERVLRVYEHILTRRREPLPHFEAELNLE